MRRYFLIWAGIFSMAQVAKAQEHYELILDENFNSHKPDTIIWSDRFAWGRCIIPNEANQYFTAGNSLKFGDSTLKLELRHEKILALVDSNQIANKILQDGKPNLRRFEYSVGLVRSKRNFLYGKFEMRCKLPKGKGTWPAFWLLGQDGEIDIFEKPWKFHRQITTNYHYDSAGIKKEDFRFTQFGDKDEFSKAFHVFTFEWWHDSLKWFIDGIMIRAESHTFRNPMEVIVNIAAARDDFWGYTPRRKKWKADLEIDYIKVWKLLQD
jgi:beta-glucanase (GH16 family)